MKIHVRYIKAVDCPNKLTCSQPFHYLVEVVGGRWDGSQFINAVDERENDFNVFFHMAFDIQSEDFEGDVIVDVEGNRIA